VGVKIQIACHTITLRCRRNIKAAIVASAITQNRAEYQQGENEVVRINNQNEAPVVDEEEHLEDVVSFSGGNSLSPGGGKASKISDKTFKFPTNPPFALKKTVFSLLLGQNFRNSSIFREGGGGGGRPPPAPPRFPPLVSFAYR
jgi:hypothetical protein